MLIELHATIIAIMYRPKLSRILNVCFHKTLQAYMSAGLTV